MGVRGVFSGNADSKGFRGKNKAEKPAGLKPHTYNGEEESCGGRRGRAKGRGIGRNATKA
jgi:hypothetical protein